MSYLRITGRTVLAAGLALSSLAPCTGACAQVENISVTYRSGRFAIAFDAVVDAPAQQVYAVLADYARLDKLNPAITAISVEAGPHEHGKRVRSVIDSCVWFFCRRIVQVEDVTEPAPNTIVARIVSGAGDFEDGWCSWRVDDEGRRTRLHYEATRTPAFWIPPLIGPWAVARSLREQLESSIVALEGSARQKARS